MFLYDSLLLQYSEKDLYTQLCYLQHVFDITKPPHSSVRCSVDTFNAYCALKEHVARTLSCSGYSVVSLTKLFRGLFPEPIKIKKEPVDDSWKFRFCVLKGKINNYECLVWSSLNLVVKFIAYVYLWWFIVFTIVSLKFLTLLPEKRIVCSSYQLCFISVFKTVL